MRRTHVSVLVLVVVASVAAPGEAAAATTCSGARSNFFDGYYTSTQNTTGSVAIIKTKSPTICTGASTFSNAWSMLTAFGNAGWAQTGYIREKDHLNGALSGFSQRVRLNGEAPVTKWFPAPAQDSTHSYQSLVNGNGFIALFIDANQVDITTWKPVDYWGSQPWSSQYSGETGHCQGDVPGLAVTKAHFTNVKILKNGSWVAPGAMGSVVNCGTKYGQAIVNATALDIWTARP